MTATPDQVEIGSFSSWFRSGKFPREWAIEQLANAASLGASFEVPGLLVEQLGSYAKEFPGECFVVLNRLVEDKDPSEVYWVGSQSAPIIAAAMTRREPGAPSQGRGSQGPSRAIRGDRTRRRSSTTYSATVNSRWIVAHI